MTPMTDPAREEIRAIAAALLDEEPQQIVRDMAHHVGDEIHALLKRHGMMMRTVAGSTSMGVLAAAQVLAEAIEFGRRSMDGDANDEKLITAAACEIFMSHLPEDLRSYLTNGGTDA